MLNLDTNIVLFLVEGSLTAREAKLLESNDCGISHIVVWEIAKLHGLGRIQVDLYEPLLLHVLSTLTQWPVSIDVCRCTARLDFRSDPADEIIAATSIAHGVPMLTRDRKILASKVVPLAV